MIVIGVLAQRVRWTCLDNDKDEVGRFDVPLVSSLRSA